MLLHTQEGGSIWLGRGAFDPAAADVLPKARLAGNEALELDDTLSQAHHSLAWVELRA